MLGLGLVLEGHGAQCLRVDHCGCDKKIYVITGLLAIFVGVISSIVSINNSITLFSDAGHALADGLGDFSSIWVQYPRFKKVVGFVLGTKKLHQKIQAFLMLVAILFAGEELLRSNISATYSFVPLTVFFTSCFAIAVHLIRFFLLKRNEATARNDALLRHIKVDAYHSLLVLITACTVMLSVTLEWGISSLRIDAFFTLTLIAIMLYHGIKILRGKHDCGNPFEDHEGHDH